MHREALALVAHLLATPQLPARAVQHEIGQSDDEPRFFGNRNEGRRADRAELRVLPAGQGLEAGQRAGRQAEERLILDTQLARGQRCAQLAFEQQPLGDLGAQANVEHRIARLACGLGPVHRDVGVAQHFTGVGVGNRTRRDADARARVDLGAGDLAQHAEQPLGQRDGVVDAAGAFDQDRELVAAQSRDHVARSHMVLDALRDLHQELVADAVTQAVVDQLKAIEIEEQYAELMPRVVLAARDRLA